ncbi:MAG: hypothetical protein H6727_04095 [Myxococcales bacterium]|nr:hypothetical protein [Myxococcales bacterium]
MIWHNEEFQQRIWQWNLRASFVWLFLGGLGGLLLTVERLFPGLLENVTFFPVWRLSLSALNLLLFGWGFSLLFGASFLRIRSLHQTVIAYFPLWELAFVLWQTGVALGLGFALFGQFTMRPGLSWSPIAYGFLFVSALLYLGVLANNFPRTKWFEDSISFWLFCAGLWSLALGLFGFCSLPLTADIFSNAFLDLVLGLGLLLTTLSLLVPPSRYQLPPTETRNLRVIFWVYMIALPFSAPFFSGGATQVGLFIGAPFLFAAAAFAITFRFWTWWSHPLSYQEHLQDPSQMEILRTTNNTLLQLPPWALGTEWKPARFDGQHPWRNFLQAGALSFVLLAFEGCVFSVLRVAGYHPSPTWNIARELLWLATFAFWLQGSLLLSFGKNNPVDTALLKKQWKDGLYAVGLWILGLWLETMLHTTLQAAGAGRDSLRPLLPRALQLVGIYYAARALFAFVRIYGPYAQRNEPQTLPQHLVPTEANTATPQTSTT